MSSRRKLRLEGLEVDSFVTLSEDAGPNGSVVAFSETEAFTALDDLTGEFGGQGEDEGNGPGAIAGDDNGNQIPILDLGPEQVLQPEPQMPPNVNGSPNQSGLVAPPNSPASSTSIPTNPLDSSPTSPLDSDRPFSDRIKHLPERRG